MSRKSSSSKEFIIPIQVEGRDEEPSEMDTSQETQDLGSSSKTGTSSDEGCTLVENTSSDDDELPVVEKNLPLCNAREKIILVLDCVEDEPISNFKLNNTTTSRPIAVLKPCLEHFVRCKQLINSHHEYALVFLMGSDTVWRLNFTNNINQIIKALQDAQACEPEDIFDLNNLFDMIANEVKIPDVITEDDTIMPPPYIVRTILFYGRSYTVPKLRKTKYIQSLLDSPYFTLDVLMTHEPPGENNNCEKIIDELQSIDKKGVSYFFSVERDTKELYVSVAKLLSHPLQRPIQKLANYSIVNKI